MSHIVDFSIQGLAGRKDVYSQALKPDVNVFFGLNGSGKTSLLRILAAALERDASSLISVPFRKADVRIFSTPTNQVLTLTVDKVAYLERQHSYVSLSVPAAQMAFPATTWAQYEQAFAMNRRRTPTEPLAWSEAPEPTAKVRGLKYNFLSIARLYFSADRRSGPRSPEIDSEEALNAAFETLLTQKWTSYSSETQYKVRQTQQQGLYNILQEVLAPPGTKDTSPPSQEGASVAYSKIERFLKRENRTGLGSKKAFEQRFRQEPLLRNVVGHIEQVEADVDQVTAPQNKLQELLARLFLKNKRVLYRPSNIDVVTDGDERIGLASLSSGEKHLLRIFLEAMLAAGGPLLIDEPELSMHIDWQRELIGDIRELNSTSQVIVATHSPEIMANIDDSHIFKI